MEEFFQKKGPLLGTAGKLVKRFYNYIFSSVNGIIVPDYPLPYSVNRKKISRSQGASMTISFSAAPLSDAGIGKPGQKPSSTLMSFQHSELSVQGSHIQKCA